MIHHHHPILLLLLLLLSLENTYSKTIIVVPCYNEVNRIDLDTFESFQKTNNYEIEFLFVDDGSTDGTFDFVSKRSTLRIMRLEENQGKAEAVRIGMLRAISSSSSENVEFTGFFDADLATPLNASIDFLNILLREKKIEMVFFLNKDLIIQ